MLVALTRAVSEEIGSCELTHLGRVGIDVERARGQHAGYERALEGLGVSVRRVGGGEGFADGVFVEDAAVVVEEVGVMMRPGAVSRRGEAAGVAAVLREYRELVWVEGPGTVDGGDVLVVGKRVYVGRSSRTNGEGILQLEKLLGRFGYSVVGVEVKGCLHLKSAATCVAEGVVLLNPAWVDVGVFGEMEWVEVDPSEGYGANAVRVGEAVLFPAHFPRTAERLRGRGLRVVEAACDELAKAEGALTCCSLLFMARSAGG
jgi:dimethylargininase